jgi:hypothetical protein
MIGWIEVDHRYPNISIDTRLQVMISSGEEFFISVSSEEEWEEQSEIYGITHYWETL